MRRGEGRPFGRVPVHTSLDDRLAATGDYETARSAFIARQPMGRIAVPEEVADLAVYLAHATYTTGQVVSVDGGWTI